MRAPLLDLAGTGAPSMTLLLNLSLAAIPGILWLWVFYRKDRYEPEPKRLVLLAFVLGGLAVLVVKLLAPLAPRFPARPDDLVTLLLRSLVVAATEEIPKFLVLYLVFFRHPEFNEPMDGIVYGASIGIGFSTLENALYMREFGRQILLFRMFVSTGLHVSCSSLVGYALGQIKFARRGVHSLGLAAAAALAVHLAFDTLTSVSELDPELSWIAPASLVGLLFLMVFVFHVLDLGVEDALAKSPFRRPRFSLRRKKRVTVPTDASSTSPDREGSSHTPPPAR